MELLALYFLLLLIGFLVWPPLLYLIPVLLAVMALRVVWQLLNVVYPR